MPLMLRAVSLNAQPLTQPIHARFDGAGGTIGRADHNTMALPDPERHISRKQAQIDADAAGYTIRNVGSANRIGVGQRLLVQGESAPLAPGDAVRIGDYLLEVADAGEEVGGDGAKACSPRRTLRSPFDPVTDAPVRARGADAEAAPAARDAGVFDDLIPGPAPASIDELFDLRAPTRDALVEFLSEAPRARGDVPGGAVPPAASLDPLRLFDVEAARRGTPSMRDAVVDDLPLLRTAFRPPPVPHRREADAAATSRRAASAGEAAADGAADACVDAPVGAMTRAVGDEPIDSAVAEADDAATRESTLQPLAEAEARQSTPEPLDDAALWSVFCDAAGIELTLARTERAAAMQRAGALLRAAADGTLQLVGVRAATRHELHAQVTMIQPERNNPLKFSPDGRAALEQLLRPPLRGFLSGPDAMVDAMHDLVGHAIGTMAGMRAALGGVLDRFAPDVLEQRLATRSLLDSVLPASRRARLWELYRQHHAALRDEAQDDFHALFGKAFLAAYEQQLERLELERGSPPA